MFILIFAAQIGLLTCIAESHFLNITNQLLSISLSILFFPSAILAHSSTNDTVKSCSNVICLFMSLDAVCVNPVTEVYKPQLMT